MENPHIAIVPSPGFSHLVPILEFSKRLLHLHHEFRVTCIIPSLGPPPPSSQTYLQTLPPTINFIFLPPISKHQLPQHLHISQQIQLGVTHSLPHIHQELKSLCSRTRVVALVVDVFANPALDFARDLKLLSYVYLPLSAMIASFYFHSKTLDQVLSSKDMDPQEPIILPGCVPIAYSDLPQPCYDLSSEAYKEFLIRSRRCLSLPDGVLVNSFLELEEETVRVLKEQIRGKPKIFPVGPIIQSMSIDHKNGLECLTWLDKQEPSFVLYVAFGSGGTLSQEQSDELAFGLELSGVKFLWVVRAPSDKASAGYFGGAAEESLRFLPHGFVDRTKNHGLVVPFWAPQIQILTHGSVGGFLCHCGWNSVLESVVKGVPIVAWPLFAEQSLNAVLLTDGLKVALRPKVNENGIVPREEIAKVVSGLMRSAEGADIRKRMECLKNAASKALEEDGSSRMALSELAADLRDHPH
ncbi:hypothetical protein PIB30_072661 [Stylosanthes scabra]|uniref:Glycosyltransferase n=1 Tax=Stylosanthes scabra TaxID=79078 RepID=A0ABU6ZMX2_9FABA|nr:hypothetical protein [Stylosanthes scabra]